jgi:hypothetical protein
MDPRRKLKELVAALSLDPRKSVLVRAWDWSGLEDDVDVRTAGLYHDSEGVRHLLDRIK